MARVVFLTGYMACGKSTLGTALASSAGVEFIDMDQAIEAEAGRTISQIFSERGEAEFRSMESAMLRNLIRNAQSRDGVIIIGCGGGTPCFGDNMERMLRAGTVVWLQASRERTIARLLEAAADGRRPLMANLDAEGVGRRHDSDMATRMPHYARAHATFDSSFLDNETEIEQSVRRFRETFL